MNTKQDFHDGHASDSPEGVAAALRRARAIPERAAVAHG